MIDATSITCHLGKASVDHRSWMALVSNLKCFGNGTVTSSCLRTCMPIPSFLSVLWPLGINFKKTTAHYYLLIDPLSTDLLFF